MSVSLLGLQVRRVPRVASGCWLGLAQTRFPSSTTISPLQHQDITHRQYKYRCTRTQTQKFQENTILLLNVAFLRSSNLIGHISFPQAVRKDRPDEKENSETRWAFFLSAKLTLSNIWRSLMSVSSSSQFCSLTNQQLSLLYHSSGHISDKKTIIIIITSHQN